MRQPVILISLYLSQQRHISIISILAQLNIAVNLQRLQLRKVVRPHVFVYRAEYTEDALAAFATDRTASRIAQFEALDRMIDAGGAHSDEAAAQKLKLVDFMEDETTVEGVLRAQGCLSIKPAFIEKRLANTAGHRL